MGVCDRPLQACRLSAPIERIGHGRTDRRSGKSAGGRRPFLDREQSRSGSADGAAIAQSEASHSIRQARRAEHQRGRRAIRHVPVGRQGIRASRSESLVAFRHGEKTLMKTDELIDVLATNLERVKGGELRNTVMIALAIGAAAAFCFLLAMFGVPAAAPGAEFSLIKILAMAFTLGLVAAGASLL